MFHFPKYDRIVKTMIQSADYQNLLNVNAICNCFIVTGLFNCFSENTSLQTDIVVITTPQLNTTKPKFSSQALACSGRVGDLRW